MSSLSVVLPPLKYTEKLVGPFNTSDEAIVFVNKIIQARNTTYNTTIIEVEPGKWVVYFALTRRRAYHIRPSQPVSDFDFIKTFVDEFYSKTGVSFEDVKHNDCFTAVIGRKDGYDGEVIEGNPYTQLGETVDCLIYAFGPGWSKAYVEPAFFIKGNLQNVTPLLEVVAANYQKRLTVAYWTEENISITFETPDAPQQ